MQIDTPATDIARLLGSLVDDDANSWRAGLAAYATIHPLSQSESQAVYALDKAVTILAGCNWIRWIWLERRQFDQPQKVAARFAKLLARVRRMQSN
jgi:hypothetical protein